MESFDQQTQEKIQLLKEQNIIHEELWPFDNGKDVAHIHDAFIHKKGIKQTEEKLWQALDDQHMVDMYLTKEGPVFFEKHYIDVNVIENAFVATQHGNISDDIEDGGIVGEYYSNEDGAEDGFCEFCQLYMETLREVIATPKDPGLTY